jgi:hypothetical protein
LSAAFPIHNGLKHLEYATGKTLEGKGRLEITETTQHLIYADDGNLLGENINITKKT